jgi:hypothetical protein
MGLSGGYGAGAGANALQDLLKQKFLEQIENRRAHEAQQALGQGQQRIDQDTSQFGQRHALDTQALAQRGEQFGVESGFKERGLKLDEGMQPTRIAHMGAQTADLERQPQEALDSRVFAEAQEALRNKNENSQIDRRTAGALRIANARQQDGGASGASGAPQPKPMGPVAQAKVADIDTSLHTLGKLETMAPKMSAFLGPIAGRAASQAQGFPGIPTSPDFAAFTAETAALKNATIKAITGAGLGEAEAQRIMQQIPDVTDKPEVWAAKAKATRDNATFMRKRTMELAGGGGEPAAAGGGGQEFDYVPGKGLVPR